MEEISAEAEAALQAADVDSLWANTPTEAACLPTWKNPRTYDKFAQPGTKLITTVIYGFP
jgi:hypothetical protein